MDDILSSTLAVEMRIHGLSNEEILLEIGEWAEMFELEALVRRVKARQLREMEIISEELR